MRALRKALVLILICSLIFSGCSKGEEMTAPENEYSIYYLDSSGMELLEYKYVSETGAKGEELIDELIAQMITPPKGSDYNSVIPSSLVRLDRKIENELLSVDFSDEYYTLAASDEVMFRAAYVKTMTQIEGVRYVSFYVNSQPLVDAMGKVVGIMLASDFVEAVESGAYNTWVDLSVYYSNEEGDKLCAEKITVGYGKNASVERVIVEQLIKGPSEEGHRRTVPASLTLMSISTKDGICYLNFDASFLEAVKDVNPLVTIYSIVNSLCELSYVSKVSISVNGNNSVMFWDMYDLSVPYERNLDIIE